MCAPIQIRDLIDKLKQAGDDSQYVTVETEDESVLPILDFGRLSPRNWSIRVTNPTPDEDALEEAEDKGFAKGYNEARNDAVKILDDAGAKPKTQALISTMKGPHED